MPELRNPHGNISHVSDEYFMKAVAANPEVKNPITGQVKSGFRAPTIVESEKWHADYARDLAKHKAQEEDEQLRSKGIVIVTGGDAQQATPAGRRKARAKAKARAKDED